MTKFMKTDLIDKTSAAINTIVESCKELDAHLKDLGINDPFQEPSLKLAIRQLEGGRSFKSKVEGIIEYHQKRQAALSKLTEEDQEVLGITVIH